MSLSYQTLRLTCLNFTSALLAPQSHISSNTRLSQHILNGKIILILASGNSRCLDKRQSIQFFLHHVGQRQIQLSRLIMAPSYNAGDFVSLLAVNYGALNQRQSSYILNAIMYCTELYDWNDLQNIQLLIILRKVARTTYLWIP